ncbi:MAG: cyclase [Leptolyngbyaceae cyanobacterium SM1_1_3]|nr:cyclase [Leptolyngbyaceae cyanobacterium SM1_1_3]NJN03680.1 cyclase [Leptolyngbyaceae cyanobacterium RM1_1_2]NJO09143.1 cyclase [Leptolyngbyaceae cyanobacterium SL_1_1]
MENSISRQIPRETPKDQKAGDLERWASIVGGGAMVLSGLQQRSLRGILMAIAGGGLVYQGTQGNSTVKQVEDAIGLDHAIRVEKTVTINRSAPELYSFWRDLENLPRFMQHLRSVTVLDDRRSHWVANLPLNQTIEWDAVIINDEPNHLIAWASAPNAEIENSGFVRFQPATGNRGTEVKVVMEYQPPGGLLAAAIAKLFGEEPEQQIGDELSRFKQLMEAGEIATVAGQPQGA